MCVCACMMKTPNTTKSSEPENQHLKPEPDQTRPDHGIPFYKTMMHKNIREKRDADREGIQHIKTVSSLPLKHRHAQVRHDS